MTTEQTLQTRIEQCCAKITAYERAIAEARAELSAYREALALVSKVAPVEARSPQPVKTEPGVERSDRVRERVRLILETLPPDGSPIMVGTLLRMTGVDRNQFAAVTRSGDFRACAVQGPRGSWRRRVAL